jgi:hypothetical protein
MRLLYCPAIVASQLGGVKWGVPTGPFLPARLIGVLLRWEEARGRVRQASQTRGEQMETWEYMIETDIGSRDELIRFLNQMGTQGWEAVSVQLLPANPLYGILSRGDYYEATLKCRKQQG